MADKKNAIIGEFLRYDFSEEEMRERSKKLALAVQTQTQAQEEQKAAQAQFKERIESCTSQIGRLSRDINMGWEMRTIDCEVFFHTPTQATKRIVRIDTGELVREQAMLASELQENLFASTDAGIEDSTANIGSFFGDALEKELNREGNTFQKMADRDGITTTIEHNGKTVGSFAPKDKA